MAAPRIIAKKTGGKCKDWTCPKHVSSCHIFNSIGAKELNFESELKQGRFTVGKCTKCHNTNWPPSEYCSKCFGELSYSPVKEPGIVIEWSSKDGQTFGIVEFEGIRVMGAIQGTPKQGQKAKITNCTFDGSPKFTFSVF
ncbi:MAG: hypothetical protein EB150_05390 [Nitrososphaeria archaeon]|nr:hypothetical protein [Nitrosopumilaceae archaeon]NDF29626.1 hypothetical protein [Nitrososphaeria archaeon]NDF35148.1 hypothetical protein [Nitrosopumilaceae archaeon]